MDIQDLTFTNIDPYSDTYQISEIFDVRDFKNYNPEYEKLINAELCQPYTFIITVGGIIVPKNPISNLLRWLGKGFESVQRANVMHARMIDQFIDNIDIAILFKNADSTEGGGPMMYHSTWTNYSDLYSYLADKKCMGANNCLPTINYSVTASGDLATYISFGNGNYEVIFDKCR